MSKPTYAPGRRGPAGRLHRQTRPATRRAAQHRIAKRPPTRYRTPRRPTVRCRKRQVVVTQTRQDLAFMLLGVMFVLILLSPLLTEALAAFDKLLPILALVLGHYFGQK